MSNVHVESLRPDDRVELTSMLEDSGDFPMSLLGQYRTGRGPYEHLVAWQGERIDGVLTGSFDTDLRQSGAFAAFRLPAPPHAFLARIHVRDAVRGCGIGRKLVEVYVAWAVEYGCTFIGGSLDLSSDPARRRAFFGGLGFSIRQHDNFGARPSSVLAAIGARQERL